MSLSKLQILISLCWMFWWIRFETAVGQLSETLTTGNDLTFLGVPSSRSFRNFMPLLSTVSLLLSDQKSWVSWALHSRSIVLEAILVSVHHAVTLSITITVLPSVFCVMRIRNFLRQLHLLVTLVRWIWGILFLF